MTATSYTPAKVKRGIGIFFITLLLLVAFLCFFSALWYVNTYGRLGFDSILYTLSANLDGVQSGLIADYLLKGALPAPFCAAATALLLFLPRKRFIISRHWVRSCVAAAISLGLIGHAAIESELVDYVIANLQKSALFETEYRSPEIVDITFPEEKRNLVYIYLESMETTYLGKDMNGGLEQNLIPELTQLAQENTNFSHNDTVGGFQQTYGSAWTIGAMVAQTSGVPLKVPANVADGNSYGGDGIFLPGLTSLTDILRENGYYQTLMVGSDSRFGGRDAYYRSHGADKIYDLYTARADGIVPEDYYVWWGMEDMHLFEYAKQELPEIAAKGQPFAFTMLTVDTHHIGGYICQLCGDDHEESYENAISCSSKQVYAFVRWLQQQPFYENTTVIIAGDHFSMDGGYFSRNIDEDCPRRVYNCFLNAAATPVSTKNRVATSLDMFPTTLAALGCTVDGNRLGLGTNLFSDLPTLAEMPNGQAFLEELAKDSAYYTKHFFEEN